MTHTPRRVVARRGELLGSLPVPRAGAGCPVVVTVIDGAAGCYDEVIARLLYWTSGQVLPNAPTSMPARPDKYGEFEASAHDTICVPVHRRGDRGPGYLQGQVMPGAGAKRGNRALLHLCSDPSACSCTASTRPPVLTSNT